MFKRFLSKIGIGSASIDFVLQKDYYETGENIVGAVHVKGGSVDEEIQEIELKLVCESKYVTGDTTHHVREVVSETKIPGFRLAAGEAKSFDVTIRVPRNIPISASTTFYYVATDLEIDAALDPTDRDYVKIGPSGLLHNVLEGLNQLGIRISAEGYTGREQILYFKATDWKRGELDELEFHYVVRDIEHQFTGFFEVEKKTRSAFLDHLDLNEKKGRFTFSASQLSTPVEAKRTLQQFIEGHLNSLLG